MKKKDLVSIIKKLQNRCCLEDPVKITYFFDQDKNVIFKFYFESLYIPKQFRLHTDKVQNLFTPPNAYTYEDDFKILELNQDEGYVTVQPDCQNFEIVNSYSTANKISLNAKNESVCLAGKRLNEDFAKASGYILYEVVDPSDMQSASDISKAVEQKVEDEKPKTPINLVIIGVTCPVTKNGVKTFEKALDVCYGKNLGSDMAGIKMAFKNQEAKLKVAVTVPYIDGKVIPSFAYCSIKYFAKEILDRTGETYTYVAASGNAHFTELINSSEIAQVAYITTTAKQGIKDNNFPAILAAEEVEFSNIVEDNTKKDYEELKKIIENQINLIEDFEKVESSKEQVQYYDKIKNTVPVKNLLSLYKDFYPSSQFDSFIAFANKRQEIIHKIVAGVTNPTSGLDALSKFDAARAVAEGAAIKATLDTIGQFEGSLFNRETEKSDNKVSSAMFSGMSYAGGKSAASVNKSPVKVEPKKPEAIKVTYTDVEVSLLVAKTADRLTVQAQRIKTELLDENVDFGTEPATEESKENQEATEAEESQDQKATETETEKDQDEKDMVKTESVIYRRLKKIFEG